jgi:hypothetical protein
MKSGEDKEASYRIKEAGWLIQKMHKLSFMRDLIIIYMLSFENIFGMDMDGGYLLIRLATIAS